MSSNDRPPGAPATPWRLVVGHLLAAGVYMAAALLMPLGGFQWLFVWPAASRLLVAAAYVRQDASWLGKRADGSVRLPAALILLPYTLGRRAVLGLAHGHRTAWHQVAPGLILGGRLTPPPPGVQTVVDLVAELPETRALRAVPHYRNFPVLDRWAPRPDDLAGWLAEIERLPEPIFVHCAAGKGRSGMVMAALFVRRGIAADVTEAERMLRVAREGVRLHPAQRRAVEAASSPAARPGEGR